MKINIFKQNRSYPHISPTKRPGQEYSVNEYPAYNICIDNDSDSQLTIQSVMLEINGLSINFPGDIKPGTVLEPWDMKETTPQMPELLLERFAGWHPQAVQSLIGAEIVVNSSVGVWRQPLPPL